MVHEINGSLRCRFGYCSCCLSWVATRDLVVLVSMASSKVGWRHQSWAKSSSAISLYQLAFTAGNRVSSVHPVLIQFLTNIYIYNYIYTYMPNICTCQLHISWVPACMYLHFYCRCPEPMLIGISYLHHTSNHYTSHSTHISGSRQSTTWAVIFTHRLGTRSILHLRCSPVL